MKRGRPTNQERAERARLALEREREGNPRSRLPKFGPEAPRGLGWGGAREGSGRPKREGNPNYKFILIRLEWGLAAKLEVLPEGTRSEYIRKAIDLMADLVAPQEFQRAEPARLPSEPELPSETKLPSETERPSAAQLATKLEALPEGARSEYLRKAVELMVTISPPEKFKASEEL